MVLFLWIIYFSDNIQLDLVSLGASELLRYDFGHCNIDKVCPELFFLIQSYLSTVWIVEILQNCIRDSESAVDQSNKQLLLSQYYFDFSSFNSLRELVPMKVRRKLKVWLKER